MTRQPIDVRRAGVGDVEDLVYLWTLAREDLGPLARSFGGVSPEQARSRLREALLGDDVQIVIARWDGSPAGYALLRFAPPAALLDGLALQIEHLFVVCELRRHGVARALLTVVTGIAEREGADQIVSAAPPGARDSHRFLARLGFSPVVVRRVAATAVLRRKLAGEGHRRGLEDLLSRRRSLRARAGRLRHPEPAAGEPTFVPRPAAGDAPPVELVVVDQPDGDPLAGPGPVRELIVVDPGLAVADQPGGEPVVEPVAESHDVPRVDVIAGTGGPG